MLTTLLTAAVLLLLASKAPQTTACPPPFPNSTTPTNGTVRPQPPRTAPRPICQTSYPSSIFELNSLYPTTPSAETRFFQVIHQANQSSAFRLQVAAEVQFRNLPASNAVPCRLELLLPDAKLSRMAGPSPQFHVFAVQRELGTVATWETYEARNGTDNVKIVGLVDGSSEAIEKAKATNGGVVRVYDGKCNETLIFQMGMVEPKSAPWINYWDWVEVSPPAAPAQGWRIVFGC